MIPESYLMHHGVEGQQWGIQNGPPYPLTREGKRALRAQRKADERSLQIKGLEAERAKAATGVIEDLNRRAEHKTKKSGNEELKKRYAKALENAKADEKKAFNDFIDSAKEFSNKYNLDTDKVIKTGLTFTKIVNTPTQKYLKNKGGLLYTGDHDMLYRTTERINELTSKNPSKEMAKNAAIGSLFGGISKAVRATSISSDYLNEKYNIGYQVK